MTDSATHTHQSQKVSDLTASGSSISPADRKEATADVGGFIEGDPINILGLIWELAPDRYDQEAYEELVVKCIHIGNGKTRVAKINNDLQLSDSLPPLTKVKAVNAVLSIDHEVERVGPDEWVPKATTISLGPLSERLAGIIDQEISPKSVAEGVALMVDTGDTSSLEEIFAPDGTTRQHRPTGPAGGQSRPATAGGSGRRRNEPIVSSHGDLFSTPPFSRLRPYRGRFEPDLARPDENTQCGISDTRRGNLGHESRDRRTIEDIPVARQEELLRREPLGWVPDKPVPTPTYGSIIEWRPILEWSAPLMSINQLILTSTKRDDNAATERICAGMPAACELVCAAFGYKPQRAWDVGLNAGIFLELYQSRVDSDLTWSDWNSKRNRARVVLNHSIPHEIMNEYLEFTMSPESEMDRTFLISGGKANTRDALRPERDKRERTVNTNEPRIDPPATTLKMKEYLNGLSKQHVFTDRYGVFGGDAFEELAQKAHEIDDEERRRMELRKIYHMRAFPKPLYAGCDRSPRLRADAYNQLMNLKTELRMSLYEEGKDLEPDLSKAHLASYVPTVRDHGIETPQLDRYLQANLEDDTDLLAQGDLWMELAQACDTEVMDNLKALRGAVKRLYAVPYGMKWAEVRHEICSDYDDYGGRYPDSNKEPLVGLRSHPLVSELLETRETLREIINKEGGLYDASGRFIPLSAWNKTKDREDRWRGLMSYINASYETEIVGAAFEEAIKEKERDARTRFKIWLYQADGFTIRVSSKASANAQVKRLKQAVADKAEELSVPTKLEVDWPE